MEELELVQRIGNEVCEVCGTDSDCDEKPEECFRIMSALELLKGYKG